MRWKLGLPLLPNPPQTCSKCGEPQDPFGDHAVRCRKNSLWQRHNDLRTTFSSILDLAGYSYRLEAHAPSRRRPADILVSGLEWRLLLGGGSPFGTSKGHMALRGRISGAEGSRTVQKN